MLFDEQTSRKVLMHYWQHIWKDLRIPLMAQDDAVDIYRQIVQQTGAKPAKVHALFGAVTLLKQIGVRPFRALMEEYADSKAWQRLKKELDALEFSGRQKFTVLANIGKAVAEFTPLRLRDYEL